MKKNTDLFFIKKTCFFLNRTAKKSILKQNRTAGTGTEPDRTRTEPNRTRAFLFDLIWADMTWSYLILPDHEFPYRGWPSWAYNAVIQFLHNRKKTQAQIDCHPPVLIRAAPLALSDSFQESSGSVRFGSGPVRFGSGSGSGSGGSVL